MAKCKLTVKWCNQNDELIKQAECTKITIKFFRRYSKREVQKFDFENLLEVKYLSKILKRQHLKIINSLTTS